MTTDQVLMGVGLTLVLAVGSQVLAGRLRIPALIVLLPVGFAAGALVDEAGRIGTPYVHQASVRGAGADCLGLVRGVWREILGEEPEVPPPYTADWGETGREELLMAAGLRHMAQVTGGWAEGQVLLFRMREGEIGAAFANCSSSHPSGVPFPIASRFPPAMSVASGIDFSAPPFSLIRSAGPRSHSPARAPARGDSVTPMIAGTERLTFGA